MQSKFFISRLDNAKDLPLPKYMTDAAAGMDLYANVTEAVIIKPGEYKPVPTGIRISIPEDYEAQVRPRSGLALKHGITLLNSPGTIDSDYRGEIGVILINFGVEDFSVTRGMRIARMVVNRIDRVSFIETDDLGNTERGGGGFGHTGS